LTKINQAANPIETRKIKKPPRRSVLTDKHRAAFWDRREKSFANVFRALRFRFARDPPTANSGSRAGRHAFSDNARADAILRAPARRSVPVFPAFRRFVRRVETKKNPEEAVFERVSPNLTFLGEKKDPPRLPRSEILPSVGLTPRRAGADRGNVFLGGRKEGSFYFD
jgi:hypothetical protein